MVMQKGEFTLIKNIVFDMGGVLIEWNPEKMLNQLHLSEADNALLNRELLHNKIWTDADKGIYNEAQLEAMACANLPKHLHESVHTLIKWYNWFLIPMPGMAALVRELKENGYHIYLLSNAPTNLRKYFAQIPGAECFDALMVSAEEQLTKPAPEIYQRLFQKFGMNPAECWFTDDNAPNVDSAVQAGMQATVFHGDVALLRKQMIAAGIRCREDAE